MCNIPWNVADNAELELFFEKWVPGAKIPDRRKLSGTYLDEAVESVIQKTRTDVRTKFATGQSDGWKNIAKTSVITSMMSVERQAHLLQTHNMAGLPKTGEQHCEIIKADMKYMRDTYEVHPIAWVTDDGPDGKGARNLLRKLFPWLVTLVCWGHQANLLAGDFLTFPVYSDTISSALDIVRWFNNHSAALDLFNQEQTYTYRDRPRPRALFLPAVTRWTTTSQTMTRLIDVKSALKTCVVRHREQLLEIGEKSQTANAKESARKVIASIEDEAFWSRLDRAEANLKPIAVATNILQASHTRLDHVLLTLGNLYRIYSTDESADGEVRERMLLRLELRWKKGAGKDQDLFILAVFFNPFIRGYCFNREAISSADIFNMATLLRAVLELEVRTSGPQL
ncbi:hypothetical protein OH77DRAFT_1594337, partial [Trametes cingulata]